MESDQGTVRGGLPAARSPLPSAPFARTGPNAAGMTWTAVLCLLPSAAWGVFVFGPRAGLVLAVSVCAALMAELLAALLRREVSLGDGSALFSGLLIGCLLPPGVPLYVPATAAAFAMIVVKQTFGGLGRNWMNPALAGVIVARVSWPDAFGGLVATRWTAAAASPLSVLPASATQASAADAAVLGWLHAHLLGPLGLRLQQGAFDLFVGIRAGGIGELSVPLLLAGAALLSARRLIRWQLPAAYLGSFALLAWVLGGLPAGNGLFAGRPLFHLVAGSLLLIALFSATDPVTSPLTVTGQLIHGAGCGCLTFLLRFYGSIPDGAALAVLLMNCVAPLIDVWTRPARFSTGRAEARNGS